MRYVPGMRECKPSEATTDGIRVSVTPRFLEERAKPVDNHYFFSYEVTISNVGSEPAKLVSRHWIITDANGTEEHVRGPGVVGHTPHLAPGEAFRYESFCPLETVDGSMHGTFQMVRDDGTEFEAEVGKFFLCAPLLLN